jgi:hypothetical protein
MVNAKKRKLIVPVDLYNELVAAAQAKGQSLERYAEALVRAARSSALTFSTAD